MFIRLCRLLSLPGRRVDREARRRVEQGRRRSGRHRAQRQAECDERDERLGDVGRFGDAVPGGKDRRDL